LEARNQSDMSDNNRILRSMFKKIWSSDSSDRNLARTDENFLTCSHVGQKSHGFRPMIGYQTRTQFGHLGLFSDADPHPIQANSLSLSDDFKVVRFLPDRIEILTTESKILKNTFSFL